MRAKKKKGIAKINVIPILDAVFIFIFFLLMSAQFVEIYEIGSDAPQISTVSSDSKKDPLNLTLRISKQSIIVTTGVNEVKRATIKWTGDATVEQKLKDTLLEIKESNKNETSIVFRPQKNVSYKKIIKLMDVVRVKNNRAPATSGKENQLFDQIVFETM